MVIQPCPAAQADRWSKSLKWWTRTQRTGTCAEVSIEAAILDANAKGLGVTAKTVAKAVARYECMIRHPDSQLFGEKPSVEVGIIRDKDEARAWLDKAA